MFKKVLIANRGEIALRVMWACKELGLKTVAVYSEADANSLHVRFADEAVCIGPPRNIESYLNIPAIISAAEITGADAIHPGYGFLSESAYLAEICEACNIRFIGPGPQAIRLMGDKSRRQEGDDQGRRAGGARLARASSRTRRRRVRIAQRHRLPGDPQGLGRRRRARDAHRARGGRTCAQNFRAAQAEAQAAFGVPDVYIEKYVEGPRHIEIQVMADSKGNVVHLGERECSIQRRHQKLIEEAPSVVVDEKLRRRMGRTAVEAAAAVQYVNAGTVEFLLDKDGNYYFMEMNTRIQVEHGVTELVTGRDLVKEQIHVAAGEPLSFSQKDVTFSGHALECRINAEDPLTFAPSPGTIRHFFPPGGPGVRVDTFAHEGCEISPYYDSMIAKLMTHGRDARRGDRSHEALPRRDGGRGHQDQHPAAPPDPRRPRLRGGAPRHALHGAVHAAEEGDRGLVRLAVSAGLAELRLVCPSCRAPLPAGAAGASCGACGTVYRLTDGILDLRAGRVGAPGFDPHYFPTLAAVERDHYWFRTRREVVRDVLRDAVPDLAERALFDVGCGSGGLLAFLGESGVPLAGACDVYPESLALVRRRVEAPLLLVDEGRFPPLGAGFTLLSLFDVLEHIDDDRGTLGHLIEILAPGGVLVLTVPAHPFLFDEMDEIAHHRRRYTRRELGDKLRGAGFRVLRLAHFMAPLVPLVALRWLARARPGRASSFERRKAELSVVPVLNGLMRALLRLERPLVRAGRLPFGSSLIAVAEKPRDAVVTSVR